MNDDTGRDKELDALRGEVARLREENAQLRGRYRVPAEEVVDTPEAVRPIRLLLLPDPAHPIKPGPQAMTNVAQVLVSHLRRANPEPTGEPSTISLRSQAMPSASNSARYSVEVWDGTGPLPKQYRIEEDDHLLNEAKAAHAAGAQHHAGWTLKTVDVALARAALALASFRAGRDAWKAELDEPRPEYDPRYRDSND